MSYKQIATLVNVCLALALILVNYVQADVSHLSTPQPEGPPNPYVFSYQAGRAPGHVDRQHTEVSDGSGVVRGAFSYVDPRNQVRTVQYVADEHGFHPQLSHATEDVEAVKLAKQKHINLYNRIAQEHANAQSYPSSHVAHNVAGPANSAAVARATQKHLSDYERIAAEHAAIGAQQELLRREREYQEEQEEEKAAANTRVAHGRQAHHSYQIPVAIRYE